MCLFGQIDIAQTECDVINVDHPKVLQKDLEHFQLWLPAI